MNPPGTCRTIHQSLSDTFRTNSEAATGPSVAATAYGASIYGKPSVELSADSAGHATEGTVPARVYFPDKLMWRNLAVSASFRRAASFSAYARSPGS